MAEAELQLHQGPLEQAVKGAAQAIQTARDHGDADLAAVATQIQGRALIAQGSIDEGLGLLDEAMTCVLAGELAPLYTGWVYCSVILACKDLADLQRASEWTEAARAWCGALPATTPYSQGLCRIYRGEVLALRGAWAEAEAEMRRAHQELLPHKPQGAAEASYGVGEVLRRRGDLAGAERAFVRAQQLGWDPQPGLALLRLAQGRVEAAAAALRSALASHGRPLRTGAPASRPGRGRDRGRRARRSRPRRTRAGDDRGWPQQRGGTCDRVHGPGRAAARRGESSSRPGAAPRCADRLAGAPVCRMKRPPHGC